MSSTGRKADRQALDDYPTPRWCVHRLFEAYDLPAGRYLEPCAGGGSIIRAVSDIRSDITWDANELNPVYLDALSALPNVRVVTNDDARQVRVFTDIAVAMTNPPFTPSLQILESILLGRALVIFLQRLNWAAGPRRDLFRKLKPSAYVLPDRPSFIDTYEAETPNKLTPGTDSIEYAWFVFDGRGEFHVLADTSENVRGLEILEGRRNGTRPRRLAKPKKKRERLSAEAA